MLQFVIIPFTVKRCGLILALAGVFALAVPIHFTPTDAGWQQAHAKKYRKYRKRKPKKTIEEQLVDQEKSNKWAAIVVDADEGKILYEKHAESRRYPASLTKMMTLYLLFDALDRRKVKIHTSMRASKKAAAQPQTNIGLKAGDRVTVKRAIEALIIRSANDVAVVVAEHLGGSERGFARRMNQKAKELGMVRTRFYNPHGLPNSGQVTTAMDMAKLSIALRRDFPHYYYYFRKTSFTHNGKTYKSHNRVVGQYPGVDGIKTGYIRASGFNLATSLQKGNSQLVAVVMGGESSTSRDKAMMNMLDDTVYAMEKQARETKYAEAKQPKTQQQASTRKPVKQLSTILADVEQMQYEETAPYLSGKNWAVQVGAFPTVEQAERAATAARHIAPEPLSHAKLHISQVMKNNRVFNRSRMLYLSADQARSVCDQMAQARKQCMVIRMEN